MRLIVIGAGLAGLTTAYYLQRDGVDVTVLDRAAGPGLETSFANGALLHPSLAEPWNAPGVFWDVLKWIGREDAPMLLRPQALPDLLGWGIRFLRNSSPRAFALNARKNLNLAIYSLQMMQRLREETPVSYDHQSRGVLAVFRSDAAQSQLLQGAAALARHGLPYSPLDRASLLKLEPALAPIGAELLGGIHFSADEGGDAHLFCVELARVLREGGAAFRFGTRVDAIRRAGSRISGIECAGEMLQADAYVLAAGSHSTTLARGAGLDLPIRPAKGYSITMPRGRAPAAAPNIGVVDTGLHAVVVPVGEDRVRVAGTAELTGFDLAIQPQRIENLKSLLRRMFPEFERRLGAEDFMPWAGLRPMCADGVPVLGATPIENFFLNTGHGHLGWTLAAGSGRLVADTIVGRPAAIGAADYALSRF